jgi:hypothetical protein
VTIVKRETLTDYVGSYIANTFSDGHVETDPANRPLSKEDVQRQIRDAEALKRAKATLANERVRYTKTQAQLLSPNSQQISRAVFDVIAGGLVTKSMTDTIRQFALFAQTATADVGNVSALLSNVPLGGEVVGGDLADEYIPTAARAVPKTSLIGAFSVKLTPPDLRREFNG